MGRRKTKKQAEERGRTTAGGGAPEPGGSSHGASSRRARSGRAPLPSRAELEVHRAGSRRRARIALVLLVLSLAALITGRYRMLSLVAASKAAGRSTDGLELARQDPLGFALFWGGLLVAFVCTLLSVLSLLHARHVERGIEGLPDGK